MIGIHPDRLNNIQLNYDPEEPQKQTLQLTSYVGPHSLSDNSDVSWTFELSTVPVKAAYKTTCNYTN